MIDKSQSYFEKLKKAVETDQLTLPTLPDVAMKIHKAVDNDNNSAQQIAEILSQDAALSTRLLQLANSPLYRARSEIDNLHMAITRLGIRIVRDLVMALAIKQVFHSKSKQLHQHFETVWKRSVEVASICRLLASDQTSLEPEQALLAGLIHNVGALPILKMAENDPELIDNPAAIEEISRHIQHKVGKMVLSFWNLPEHLISACSDWQQFDREHSGEADYVDLVQVAVVQCQSYQNTHWLPENSMISAMTRLGIEAESKLFESDIFQQKYEDTLQSLGSL